MAIMAAEPPTPMRDKPLSPACAADLIRKPDVKGA